MTANPIGPYDPPGILGVLRGAYQTAREIAAGLPVTGFRWKRPPYECPSWCDESRCTVTAQHGLGPRGDGYQLPGPMSEHRSPSSTWKRPWGGITASRVRQLQHVDRLELRLQVRLSDTSENLALSQAINIPLVVEAAVATLLAELELQARTRFQVQVARRDALEAAPRRRLAVGR